MLSKNSDIGDIIASKAGKPELCRDELQAQQAAADAEETEANGDSTRLHC